MLLDLQKGPLGDEGHSILEDNDYSSSPAAMIYEVAVLKLPTFLT